MKKHKILKVKEAKNINTEEVIGRWVLHLNRPVWITPKQAADRLQVSESLIYEHIRHDQSFPYRNLGKKRYQVNRLKLKNWWESRTNKEKQSGYNTFSGEELLIRHRKGTSFERA